MATKSPLVKGKVNQVGSVTVRWDAEYQEWIVRTALGSTYHTGDRDDAYDTAVLMDRTA